MSNRPLWCCRWCRRQRRSRFAMSVDRRRTSARRGGRRRTGRCCSREDAACPASTSLGPHPATHQSRRQPGGDHEAADERQPHGPSVDLPLPEPAGDRWADVLDLVDWPPGARAVDLGCGAGPYLRGSPARADVDAVGLDLSKGMAVEARQASGAPTVVGDSSGSLPTGAVGRVLAPSVLCHCADLEHAVGARRIIAPGGVALVVTNARSPPPPPAPPPEQARNPLSTASASSWPNPCCAATSTR